MPVSCLTTKDLLACLDNHVLSNLDGLGTASRTELAERMFPGLYDALMHLPKEAGEGSGSS